MSTEKLEEQYKELYPSLVSFFRGRIDEPDEAEDLAQDLFLSATESFNALEPVERIAAWLWSSARNRLTDFYRKRQTRRNRQAALPAPTEGEEDMDILDLIADERENLESDFFRQALTDALFDSLEELPEAQREVFLLQAVDGYTYAEISELTGVSVNTLTARKRYAVKFLRKRLEEIKEYFEDVK